MLPYLPYAFCPELTFRLRISCQLTRLYGWQRKEEGRSENWSNLAAWFDICFHFMKSVPGMQLWHKWWNLHIYVFVCVLWGSRLSWKCFGCWKFVIVHAEFFGGGLVIVWMTLWQMWFIWSCVASLRTGDCSCYLLKTTWALVGSFA
jgi:hypothetical protein